MRADNGQAQSLYDRNKVRGSLLVVVAADGSMPLVVVCLKSNVNENGMDSIEVELPKLSREQLKKTQLKFAFSKSGLLSKEVIQEAIAVDYVDYLRSRSQTASPNDPPTVRSLLFCDNLAAHKDCLLYTSPSPRDRG